MTKYLFKLLLALIIVIISIGIIIFVSKLRTFQDKVFINPKDQYQPTNSIYEKIKDDQPVNVLLLGYGGGNHDGAYLTDSIILAHINPKFKQISLITIPRDIWVALPTNPERPTYWKVNAAYALGLNDTNFPNKEEQYTGTTGAGNLAKYAVSTITGLEVDRFIAIDFIAFEKSIDALGGVEVLIEKSFDDYEFPIIGKENDLCGRSPKELPELEKIATISAMRAFPCRYKQLHFDQGITHLTGTSALELVRSRHSLEDGTDFARSYRQRNLLKAVKNKMFSVGFIPKAIPFFDSIQDHVKTDITVNELGELIKYSNKFTDYTINSLSISSENVLKDSNSDDYQYILISRDGIDEWDNVHSWIEYSINPQRASFAPIIKISNGAAIPGLASIARNRLQDLDFNVLSVSTTTSQILETTTITIFSNSIDGQIIEDLKRELGVTEVTRAIRSDLTYDILIELGKDYHSKRGKELLN